MLKSTGIIAYVPYARENGGFVGRGTFGCPVSPEHSEEFLRIFVFSFAQNFAQVVEDSAVADFGLVVALRIIGRGESMCNFVLVTETRHLLAKFVPLSEIMAVFKKLD